jgi:hypothetical protein
MARVDGMLVVEGCGRWQRAGISVQAALTVLRPSRRAESPSSRFLRSRVATMASTPLASTSALNPPARTKGTVPIVLILDASVGAVMKPYCEAIISYVAQPASCGPAADMALLPARCRRSIR